MSTENQPEWGKFQDSIDRIVNATGIDLAHKTEKVIKNSLKSQAPFAFWLLSHFPFRWFARLLRLEVLHYQTFDMSYKFEVKAYGKVIGRAEIKQNILIV